MSRIFITGIAGFLGSHLADRFLAEGHEVVGNDNLIGGYIDNVPKGAEFHRIDCADLEGMRRVMKGSDVVYHTACTAYEGLSVFSPHLVTHNTFQITVSTLSAAITCGVKRFVLCSSMARYGAQEVTPFREDMQPKPQDPYGIAKYASELILRNMAHAHGIEFVIAVPHNIIGPRQKYDDPYRNVASIMINLMLQGRQPVIYGDGKQMRCFSFVNDVIEPLARMADAPQVVGHVINVGPDEEPVTIGALAETIAGLLDFKLAPIYMPDRPQEVKHATCSADKARMLIGYTTTYTLERGLQEMIDWIRARGAKPFTYHLELEIVNDRTPKTWTNKLF